jgi:thiol-disulfide isomerase/thioredoxin
MVIMKFNSLVFGLLLVLSGCAQNMPSEMPALKNFLKDSNKPAVIKFYADWCKTCKSYAPTFEKVAGDLSNTVDFFSVDVDDKASKALVKEFKIAQIPVTLIASGDRIKVLKQYGPLSYNKLTSKIDEVVSHKDNTVSN